MFQFPININETTLKEISASCSCDAAQCRIHTVSYRMKSA